MLKDLAASVGISKAIFLDEMHLSAKQALKLARHVNKVEKSPSGVVVKLHKDVYIAVGPEVVPEDRAKKGELLDVPPRAEVVQEVLG